MAVEGGEINWYSPDPRGIIPLDEFHVPSRLARVVRRGTFRIEIDRRFEEVIRACADELRDPDDPGSWISEEIIQSYLVLHRHGLAHSVEAWTGDTLAGGLYGVALKGAFFGESMFHRVTDASKVALVALVDRLREQGFRLLDIQWVTGHLAVRGARDSTVRLPEGARREPAGGVLVQWTEYPSDPSDNVNGSESVNGAMEASNVAPPSEIIS